jgi:hypothetical protein
MSIGVIPKLTERQPSGPLVGVGTDETSEETLNGLIHTLGLSVSLRMVSSGHAKLSASRLENRLPELTGKHWITV